MNNEIIKLIEWDLDFIQAELRRISLVSQPATEEEFMLFDSEFKFKTIDSEKRVVTGIAMRPDLKIPRLDENGELYYGFFSKNTIRKASELFLKSGSNSNFTNLEHEFEVDDIYVVESWIVEDPKMDKAVALGFNNIKEGDWFISMKIDNEDVWNNYLKTGLLKGFSVEIRAEEKDIYYNLIKIVNSDLSDDDKLKELTKILN